MREPSLAAALGLALFGITSIGGSAYVLSNLASGSGVALAVSIVGVLGVTVIGYFSGNTKDAVQAR